MISYTNWSSSSDYTIGVCTLPIYKRSWLSTNFVSDRGQLENIKSSVSNAGIEEKFVGSSVCILPKLESIGN